MGRRTNRAKDRKTSRGKDRRTSTGMVRKDKQRDGQKDKQRKEQTDTLECCLYRNTPTKHTDLVALYTQAFRKKDNASGAMDKHTGREMDRQTYK